jgi:hypothetical protein
MVPVDALYWDLLRRHPRLGPALSRRRPRLGRAFSWRRPRPGRAFSRGVTGSGEPSRGGVPGSGQPSRGGVPGSGRPSRAASQARPSLLAAASQARASPLAAASQARPRLLAWRHRLARAFSWRHPRLACQKGYGLGSGISLFIATNICESIVRKAWLRPRSGSVHPLCPILLSCSRCQPHISVCLSVAPSRLFPHHFP